MAKSSRGRFGYTSGQSGSRRFRSWNLSLSVPISFTSTRPFLLLLGDDVSHNVYVVVSWHGLTAFTRPRHPLLSVAMYIYVHSRVFAALMSLVITLPSLVCKHNRLSYCGGPCVSYTQSYQSALYLASYTSNFALCQRPCVFDIRSHTHIRILNIFESNFEFNLEKLRRSASWARDYFFEDVKIYIWFENLFPSYSTSITLKISDKIKLREKHVYFDLYLNFQSAEKQPILILFLFKTFFRYNTLLMHFIHNI